MLYGLKRQGIIMNEEKNALIAELEGELSYLISGAESLEEKLKKLENALWTVNNSGYCDAMANKLMAGIEDDETLAWDKNCANEQKINTLYALLKNDG